MKDHKQAVKGDPTVSETPKPTETPMVTVRCQKCRMGDATCSYLARSIWDLSKDEMVCRFASRSKAADVFWGG
jgi:hypothetical protein